MSVTRSNFSTLLTPGLHAVFLNEFKTWSPEYTKIMNVDTSAKQYEEDVLLTGLGIMGEKSESSAVAYEDISQGYTTRYTHATYEKGVRISQEMYEDDLYGPMKKMTTAVARSAKQRMEVNGANVLNNAFSTTTGLGTDGVSLINSAHVLSIGGSQSNALSAAADLSASSLQEAINVIEGTQDEKGLNVALKAKLLIVPYTLQFTASELLDSQYKPGVADNDINALRNKGLTFDVNHYLTDTDGWFLLAEEHKLNWFWRVPLQFFKGNDFDTDDCKVKARMRFSTGFSDFRGIAGSAGV